MAPIPRCKVVNIIDRWRIHVEKASRKRQDQYRQAAKYELDKMDEEEVQKGNLALAKIYTMMQLASFYGENLMATRVRAATHTLLSVQYIQQTMTDSSNSFLSLATPAAIFGSNQQVQKSSSFRGKWQQS